MSRALHLTVAFAVFALGCTKPSVEVDAGDSPVDASPVSTRVAWDGSCPRPLHADYSGYCDRRCAEYESRVASRHAKRIDDPQRYGFGTCDGYKVFAEQDLGGGIVEYFDDAGTMVAATDDRRVPCGRFGPVPSCTPTVDWKSVKPPPGHRPRSILDSP